MLAGCATALPGAGEKAEVSDPGESAAEKTALSAGEGEGEDFGASSACPSSGLSGSPGFT